LPDPAPAAAVALAPEEALLRLKALPVPALAAVDAVPEAALDEVFVAAPLLLLTAADATPAKAKTAIATRVFFMMEPLESQF
jgi:hypothetical protein